MAYKKDRLRFTLFTGFTPAGPPGALWDHPAAVDFDYLNLDHWIALAQSLEKACFDGIFWADHSAAHDLYKGSWASTVQEAVQFPLGDPMLLAAALISSTKELGFCFSANIIQNHPYGFARKLSTIDHLSKGRVGWNIVTSMQRSAWRNYSHKDLASHAERYRRAEEYVDVVYKLLEGSWEEEAVMRDTRRRKFADPAKVHDIFHEGAFYSVPGIHTNEPSPQRTPFLFQAGTSDDGRNFSAKNAEAVFMTSYSFDGARKIISDLHGRMRARGRLPEDLLIFQHLNFVVGSTEEEAKRKDVELLEYLTSETFMTFFSSVLDADLSAIDLHKPIGDFQTEALQGQIKALAEAAPDKRWTFYELVFSMTSNRIVGTPEQIADVLENWRDAGVNGINVSYLTGANDVQSFLDHAVPELQRRGLMQAEYTSGTLREKLFAGAIANSGPRLNERHPAAQYRYSER